MTDVDMLLRDTLRDRAEVAPTATGLLTRVHTRSRLLRRRRRVGVAGAGAVAVVLAAAAVPAAIDLAGRDGGGPSGFGGPPVSGPASSGPGASRGPGATPSGPPAVVVPPIQARLAPPTYTLPVFPIQPSTGAIPGLGPAWAGVDGDVYLMHPPDPGVPSVQVFTGAAEPRFTDGEQGVQVDTRPIRVRGVTGTLRTESMSGFTEHTLVWRELSGVWIWIRAGNLDAAALVAYADGLRPGSVPVAAPFTFDLLPEGLALDNVGPSGMVFRLPGAPVGGSWEGKLAVLLNAEGGEGAANWPLRVGGRPAQIHRQDQERSIMVSLKTGNVLVIQVPPALTISDEDLVRFAAGVHVTASARAGRG
jgi:hypothetical protein